MFSQEKKGNEVSNVEFLSALNHPKVDASNVQTFFALKKIGQSAFKLLCREYIHFKYPKASQADCKRLYELYCSQKNVKQIAKVYGIYAYYENIDCMEMYEATFSILGLLHNKAGGLKGLHAFLHENLFTVNYLSNVNHFLQGKQVSTKLNLLMKRMGRDSPDCRMAAQSGRLTDSAVFLVNVYEGIELLGQGAGSTIQLAKRYVKAF